MAEETQPYRFITHTSEVGHTLVIGQIGSGKTVFAELAKQWETGHPGGSISIAQADDIEGK
ncbi:hypothetical protein D1006_40235 [Burkholderia stabilis]|uniref:Uncharacterized protein n=1 Tax=Burkholderia stabilis TaxID=95485 RepID=A0A4Q2A5T2_9BURK|nr:hypothetical protein [Burkholderia stabilis]RXV64543.1 hypothetical protein D1006_40235 [Burkholderia stabilis]